MTVDEAWNLVTSDPMPQRTRMLLTVLASCMEGQHDLAEWCTLAAGDDPSMRDMPHIWARAVAVLRLPADVLRAAQWN